MEARSRAKTPPHRGLHPDTSTGHLRHATFVINFDAFPTLKARARRKGERQIKDLLESREARGILAETPVP